MVHNNFRVLFWTQQCWDSVEIFIRVTWKIHLPSAFKNSSNGPHICALDVRKYAAHLEKFWRQIDFPSYSYKKWTLINSCCCISVQSKSPGPSTNLKNKTFSKRVFDCLDFTKCLKRSIHIRGHNYLDFFIS